MNNKGERLLKLGRGDVIRLENGHRVYARIPERYVYANRPNSMVEARTDVTIGERRRDLDMSYLAGEYVVVRTAVDGGGPAGMGNDGDYYPDGHHVWCRRVVGEVLGDEVDFYQSGSFTAVIADIEPIGRVELETRIVRVVKFVDG